MRVKVAELAGQGELIYFSPQVISFPSFTSALSSLISYLSLDCHSPPSFAISLVCHFASLSLTILLPSLNFLPLTFPRCHCQSFRSPSLAVMCLLLSSLHSHLPDPHPQPPCLLLTSPPSNHCRFVSLSIPASSFRSVSPPCHCHLHGISLRIPPHP
eukprot:GHVN01091911.1.p1 GENE.GHVN01091911.1~~GHVN01091911.1.p1  ORF type:complete len:157 (+),score=24.17 GHVN01091911.1:430-900(+)